MPPLEPIWNTILWTVLPALTTAAIVMALVTLLGGLKQAPGGAAVAFVGAAVVGFWVRSDLLPLEPPGESAWNRLPWAALAALCVGRVARIPGLPFVDGWFLRAATAFGIAWWLIPEVTRDEFYWLVPAFAGIVFLQWVILEQIGDGATLICLTLTFLVAGGVLLHGGSLKYMETATVCAAALAGIAKVALFCKADAGGAIPAVAVTLPTLLLMGQRLSTVEELHWTTFALPALAPLLLAVTLPVGQTSAFRWYSVRLILILIPLIAALALAHYQAPYDFSAGG